MQIHGGTMRAVKFNANMDSARAVTPVHNGMHTGISRALDEAARGTSVMKPQRVLDMVGAKGMEDSMTSNLASNDNRNREALSRYPLSLQITARAL